MDTPPAPGPLFWFEVLTPFHNTASFECGEDELDYYLKGDAVGDTLYGRSLTFVLMENSKPATQPVAGFVTLKAGEVSIDCSYFEDDNTTSEDDGHTPTEKTYIPVPIVELMYLARDLPWKGYELGKLLLVQAVVQTLEASSHIGFIGLHLRSTERGLLLYEEYGFRHFKELRNNAKNCLFMTTQELRESMDGAL